MTPQRVGPYEVVAELGRGGMGVVYEVRRPEFPERRLALKLILEGAADAEALLRFQREAELLARISHRSVLTIHEVGHSPQGPYMVTELVQGKSLQEHLKTGGAFDPWRATRVCAALADALAALHTLGVLHRDLKPHNVMLRPDDTPVLLDFGLAKDRDGDRLTQTGTSMGTPAYASPEQAGGERVDERTDIYGLGAVLFSLLTGRAPFEGSAPMAVIAKVLTNEPSWDTPGLPPTLVAICERALAKSPDDRFATMLDLRDALRGWLEKGEPVATPPATAVTVTVLVIVAAIVAFVVLRPPPDAPPPETPPPPPTTPEPQEEPTVEPQLPPDPVRASMRNKGWGEALVTRQHGPVLLESSTRAVFVDDERFISFSKRRVRLWSLRSEQALQEWSFEGNVHSLAVARDTHRVVAGVGHGVTELNLGDGTSTPIVPGLAAPLTGIAISDDGKQLAYAAHHELRLRTSDGDVVLPPKHPHWVVRIVFSRDGKRLLASSGGEFKRVPQTLTLHDTTTHRLLRRSPLEAKSVALAASRDGRFAWGNNLQQAAQWTAETGETIGGFAVARAEDGMVAATGINGFAFSNDDRVLYMVTGSTNLDTWELSALDPTTGKREKRARLQTPYAESLDISPDGELLLTGMMDGTVKVWRASIR